MQFPRQKDHPGASKAHGLVQRAKANSGDSKHTQLVWPDSCDFCGQETLWRGFGGVRLFLHHEDYDRPLWLMTLCCSCHARLHMRANAAREALPPKDERHMVDLHFPSTTGCDLEK